MIDSRESMLSEIRRCGILPLSKGVLPGWSVQEMTDPDFWFTTSDELGPWDWKIDVLESGSILYGKFMRRRASFATVECYRHLMNWRRSQPRYRVALGEEYSGNTLEDRMMRLLSPTLLSVIREYGSVDSGELRGFLEERVPLSERMMIGGHLEKYLVPHVKRQAVEFLLQFLEMGTWVVNGGFERIYRGPNLEYSGWQKTFLTTPELLLQQLPPDRDAGPEVALSAGEKVWPGLTPAFGPEDRAGAEVDAAMRFAPGSALDAGPEVSCTPEESREFLVSRILHGTAGGSNAAGCSNAEGSNASWCNTAGGSNGLTEAAIRKII